MQQSFPLGFNKYAYSDKQPVLIILLLQFLALKCGSGKHIKIFSNDYFQKYWHKCRIVLVLTTPILSYCFGYVIRCPLIFYPTQFTNLSLIYIPKINLSGNTGDKPNKRPPNPHPISTISTFLVNQQFLGLSQNAGCSIVFVTTLRLSYLVVPQQKVGQ